MNDKEDEFSQDNENYNNNEDKIVIPGEIPPVRLDKNGVPILEKESNVEFEESHSIEFTSTIGNETNDGGILLRGSRNVPLGRRELKLRNIPPVPKEEREKLNIGVDKKEEIVGEKGGEQIIINTNKETFIIEELIGKAKKSKVEIEVKIEIDLIDKDLFNLIKKNYVSESITEDEILNTIIKTIDNKTLIDSVKSSLIHYFE